MILAIRESGTAAKSWSMKMQSTGEHWNDCYFTKIQFSKRKSCPGSVTALDQLCVTSPTLLTLTEQFKHFEAVAAEAGTQLKKKKN